MCRFRLPGSLTDRFKSRSAGPSPSAAVMAGWGGGRDVAAVRPFHPAPRRAANLGLLGPATRPRPPGSTANSKRRSRQAPAIKRRSRFKGLVATAQWGALRNDDPPTFGHASSSPRPQCSKTTGCQPLPLIVQKTGFSPPRR